MKEIQELDIISKNELMLHLDDTNLEITANRAERKLMDALFAGEVKGEDAEGAMSVLSEFIAASDFDALQAADPDLAGHHKVDIRLCRGADGKISWQKVVPP